MLIEKAVALLNEFAESKKDDEFKEFANNLALFTLKYKNEHNINDIKVFVDLVKQNTNDKDKEQLKRAISSISLAEECIQNGFVDYEKFYINFREYKIDIASMQENIDAEILESNTDKDTISNELLESLQDLATPSVSEMLSFIKDKENTQFPFSKEETLNNKFFMLDFNKQLKRMSVQEIQKLIDNIKAKNEALRKEIEEIDEQKINLMKELKGELIDQQKIGIDNERSHFKSTICFKSKNILFFIF